VVSGLFPPFTLLALAAAPLALRVYNGIRANYGSPYALMGVMAANVSLHLFVGLGLLAGYVLAILVAALS
jgi:hypothetical protein